MVIAVLVLLGLCWGSFINALVWRLHAQQKSKKQTKQYSITTGHSMCPHCKHRLHVQDLIPVLSWVALRGRCRYCQSGISWQYPVVELVTAGLFVASYWLWPADFSSLGMAAFVGWLVCLVILVALFVYDLRWMLLPNKLVYPLTVVAGATAVCLSLGDDTGRLVGALLGALFLSGLFWTLFQVSDGKWIGGGDVKLAVALGLLAGGLVESVLLLFIASLLGSLVSAPLVIHKGRASHKVPFGPFLIAATVIVFFWGQSMLDWYTRLLGV